MSSFSQAPDVVICLLLIRKHKPTRPQRFKHVSNVNKNMLSLFLSLSVFAHRVLCGTKRCTVNTTGYSDTNVHTAPTPLFAVHCLRCFRPFLGGRNTSLRLGDWDIYNSRLDHGYLYCLDLSDSYIKLCYTNLFSLNPPPVNTEARWINFGDSKRSFWIFWPSDHTS